MSLPDPTVSTWCSAHLGSPAVEQFFEASSMSQVHGVVLDDGRRVAVKVRGADPRIAACLEAQRRARAADVLAPAPLTDVTDFGSDGLVACAEEWWEEGVPHPDPDLAPELFAELGARLIRALATLDPADYGPPPPWLRYDHRDPHRLWPPAASQRWDPHRIDLPDWLPRLASRARARLTAPDAREATSVVGHTDLNGFNTRWVLRDGAWEPIVHDWDSIAARPAAVLAGGLAADFVAGEVGAIASISETERVIEGVAVALGQPWSAGEIQIAWAAGLWVACYNAAFEHLHGGPGPVTDQLEHDGEERLARALGANGHQ